MKAEIFKENITENNKDKIEINHLKKIKNHINFLKTIIISILIIIIVIIVALSFKYYSVSNVINEAYNKLEYMENLDNYKLEQEIMYKNFLDNSIYEVTNTTYYKDGKYKIELGDGTRYLEDDSYKKICVYNDLKQIEYYSQNFIEKKKGDTINVFCDIKNYKTEPCIIRLGLSLREERFNGIDCYVIRRGNNNSYRDIWIDKKQKIVLRMVEEEYMDHYSETIYTFSENIVTDEDVDTSVLDSEQYNDYIRKDITNNATEEINLYYALYNR
jgi:hypothetical protein